MKVFSLGGDLAIRLPVAMVRVMGLKEGDDVQVTVAGNHELELGSDLDQRAVLARLRQYRGTLPADFKFDRVEANERGPGSG